MGYRQNESYPAYMWSDGVIRTGPQYAGHPAMDDKAIASHVPPYIPERQARTDLHAVVVAFCMLVLVIVATGLFGLVVKYLSS
jgi:hypothetical protein